LTEKASKNGQTLNWREPIVDLMKLLYQGVSPLNSTLRPKRSVLVMAMC